MACVPILGKRKQYQFEAIVKLHSLVSVPYVNAVTFAKLRLLNSRNSSQYSPRAEIRNHTVTWNTEHRFLCKFRSNVETTVLEPNILKISIRMETKGGKSFYKVGFVSVDLACFTALGDVTSRRRYILEGYNERHKRLDNSLLLVSFSMRQLFGDTCFRPPPENLSNCLIEPPDSDEGDYATMASSHVDKPDSVDCAIVDPSMTPATTTLLNSDACAPSAMANQSVSIDRIIESISSISPELYPAVQLSLPGSAHSNTLTSVARSTSGADSLATATVLRMVLQSEDRLQAGKHPRNNTPLSQDQLSGLLTRLLSSQSSSVLSDPIRSILEPYIVRSTETLDEVGSSLAPEHANLSLSDIRNSAPQNDGLDAAENVSRSLIPSCMADPSKVFPPEHSLSTGLTESSTSIPPDVCGDVVCQASRSDSTTAHPGIMTTSSSSSGTPISVSTTPETTPGSSPFHNPFFETVPGPNTKEHELKEVPSPSVHRDPQTSQLEGYPDVDTTIYESFDSTVCHSLPLPPNYSARRREVSAVSAAAAAGTPMAVRSKYPDYFATDSGLLLPSRRRKPRLPAQSVFPDSRLGSSYSAVRQFTALSSAYTSNSDVIPELQQEDQQAHPIPVIHHHAMSPRKPCPSTGGDSRSSGYQSHSRQSSLESQAAGGSSSALIATNPVATITEWPTTTITQLGSLDSKSDLASHPPDPL